MWPFSIESFCLDRSAVPLVDANDLVYRRICRLDQGQDSRKQILDPWLRKMCIHGGLITPDLRDVDQAPFAVLCRHRIMVAAVFLADGVHNPGYGLLKCQQLPGVDGQIAGDDDQACRLKMPVAFYPASGLYEAIGEAVHDGSLPKLKLALTKPSLLILDDFGLGEMSASAAQILLDVVDRRMRTGSLLITSQYPTEKWHSFFPDPTIADAVLDRIVHQAHRMQLKGESLRKYQGRKKLEET